MRRVITVLQDDIDNGAADRARGCALALAARRDLADLLDNGDIAVTMAALYVRRDAAGNTLTAALPTAAAEAVRAFDGGREVSPFKFEVDLVPSFGWGLR